MFTFFALYKERFLFTDNLRYSSHCRLQHKYKQVGSNHVTVTPLPINWIIFTHLLSKHCSMRADSVAK